MDKRAQKGQFILTDSSTPKRKGILHSGAGRIGKLLMRTMSLYESADSTGVISLEELCNGKLTPTLTGEVDLHDLIKYVIRGGFPGNIDVPIENALFLPQSYIEAILDDSKRLDGVKYDTSKMRLLLRSLARNETTTATKKKLLDDIKKIDEKIIDKDTILTYLDVFNR